MAISHPNTVKGSENLMTLRSKGMSPIKKIITKGYIKIRWYQHKVQGGNLITSLKKRLPAVEMAATSQQPKIKNHFLSFIPRFYVPPFENSR